MGLLDSLVAYWKLDEASGNALDAHIGNDLTDNNTVTADTGKINGCRTFAQGSTEFFSLADNSDLSTGDIDFSISCWVNGTTFANFPGILGKSDDGTHLEYWLFENSDTGRFRFGVSNDGSSAAFATADNFGAPSTGVWYFIVCWHDSVANTINIQVNNGTADATSYSSGVVNGASSFRIGRAVGSDFCWNGLIDECGFWKKVLSTDEKTALYGAGSGLSYDSFTAGGFAVGSALGAANVGGMQQLAGGLS